MPFGRPEFPRQLMRGRVIGVGTKVCTACMEGLAGKGVRMGMADIHGMDDRPIDRFGIEPIPVRRKHTHVNRNCIQVSEEIPTIAEFKNGKPGLN